jgi:glycine cleavage system aminomethyltransferase T
MRKVWYLRLDRRTTLLAGPHAALARGPWIGSSADRGELQCRDVRATVSLLSVVGPRAARLLAAAELPGGLEIGAVARDASDRSIVAVLRESQRRVLIVVKAAAADALWARLLTAGEPLGAAYVGCDALGLLGLSSATA